MSGLRHFSGKNEQLNVQTHHTEDKGDTHCASFSAVISGIPDLVGTYTQKVVRRYKTFNGSAFICRLISEPRFDSGRQGVQTTVTVHVVLEESERKGEEASIMKLYFSASRQTSAGKKNPPSPMAVAAWDELVPRFLGDIETIILDEACSTSTIV